ncbi:MAG: hypothetical protein GY838_05680, partial [bacterium]|nr:hypothetical protein [bacterium]
AQVVLVVSAFIIPRVMGAQSYGQYAAWLAMIAILRSASTLGLPMVEVRFLAPLWRLGQRVAALRLGSTIWTVKLVLAVVGGGAVMIWLELTPRLAGELDLVLVLGLLALLNYAHEAAISFYLPFGHVGTLAGFLLARALLTLVVVVACFPVGGLWGVATGLTALYGGLFALSWVFLRRMAPLGLRGFHWPSLRPHAAFSLAAWVGTLAWMVQAQFSIYAVANWVTREEAAYLGLTLQFYGFLQLIFLTARRALTPVLSELHTAGQSERLRYWGELMMRYTVAASCVSALAWALVGDEVIRILLTDAFLPVHRSATIILVCVLFYCGA